MKTASSWRGPSWKAEAQGSHGSRDLYHQYQYGKAPIVRTALS